MAASNQALQWIEQEYYKRKGGRPRASKATVDMHAIVQIAVTKFGLQTADMPAVWKWANTVAKNYTGDEDQPKTVSARDRQTQKEMRDSGLFSTNAAPRSKRPKQP
jgi:hypothetical protein